MPKAAPPAGSGGSNFFTSPQAFSPPSYRLYRYAAPEPGAYGGIVLAVAHRQFVDMGAARIRELGTPGAHVLYDLKYVLDRDESDLRL